MIVVYATTKDGQGYVQKIGEYKDIEDIEIRTSMFARDVLIEFKEENEIQNTKRS
jgi:hypothetical protein